MIIAMIEIIRGPSPSKAIPVLSTITLKNTILPAEAACTMRAVAKHMRANAALIRCMMAAKATLESAMSVTLMSQKWLRDKIGQWEDGRKGGEKPQGNGMESMCAKSERFGLQTRRNER